MRTGWGSSLLLTLALCAAVPAAAQRGVPAVRMGDSVRVTLSAADPTLVEWGSYRAFRFEARPDHIYLFAARADSARVGLRVARAAGVLTDYVASSGGGIMETRAGPRVVSPAPTPLSASLRFRPAAPGPYLLVLASPEPAEVTLHVAEIGVVAAPPRPIVPGAPVVRGELNARSGVALDDSSEFVYDLYTFRSTRGQKLGLMVSGGVGYALGRVQNGEFAELANGDTVWEGGGFTVAEDGEYAVRVRGTLDGEERVPYLLRLVDLNVRPEPRRLEVGQAVEAAFHRLTAFPAGDQLADEWVVHGAQGQRLQVTVKSPAFDTYVILGRVRDGQWQQIGFNDDDDEGTDSRLPWNVEESGDFVIRVRPFSTVPDSAVPYTVLVEPERARLPGDAAVAVPRREHPETRPVRWGAQLAGALDAGDAASEDGSPYDAWTFSAAAGQRVTITLQSEDFDAYLAVGWDEEGEWIELTSNDDIDEDTHDAQVVMVAPDTGEYTIRVNSFPDDPHGAYVLRVERR